MVKRIITAAITGSMPTPSMSPYLPYKPEDIIKEAIRSFEAGAAVVHIHVRDPENGAPSSSLDLYRQVLTEIKSQCDVVLSVTTGGGPGMTVEERSAVVPEFKPEMASLNFGSLNTSLAGAARSVEKFKFPWESEFLNGMKDDNIFANTFGTLRLLCDVFSSNRTKPELELYDVGMINNVAYMIREGVLTGPVHLQFCMGILGGIPGTVEHLIHMRNTARELLDEFTWSVCAAGRHQFTMCNTALLLDGHPRVGMEDNLYLKKGVYVKSNAELVEKVVRMANELNIEIASADEAREILGLKGSDTVID